MPWLIQRDGDAGSAIAVMRNGSDAALAAEIVRRYNDVAELRATVGRLSEQLQRLGVGVTQDSWGPDSDYVFVLDDWQPGELRMGLRYDGIQESPNGPLAQFTELAAGTASHGATFTLPVKDLDPARLREHRLATARAFTLGGGAR